MVWLALGNLEDHLRFIYDVIFFALNGQKIISQISQNLSEIIEKR